MKAVLLRLETNVLNYFTFILFFLLLAHLNVSAQTEIPLFNKVHDFGIAVGYAHTANIEMDFHDYTFDKEPSSLIKLSYDNFLTPKLAAGAYFHLIKTSVEAHYSDIVPDGEFIGGEWVFFDREVRENYSLGALVWEIGGSFKTRFLMAGKWEVKPGINIGYRKFYFDEDDMEKAKILRIFEYKNQDAEAEGLGLNASVEFLYPLFQRFLFVAETGFLTQPYGGTHSVTDVQFGPVMYLLIGVHL
ncbi:MAG: hypothetical protein JXR46_04440 [Calditrichaceae bacterium]|nr:hypothetical protein [Calditrichaceae bacterium]MBN2708275.1 hypothetical protein [Calditrichaceae bacterium]RQV95202.1 MAG: hypothetical protein EH224_08215 [Calditrichota bacterium]